MWRNKYVPTMRFCICGHGKDGHRDGRGRCLGERLLAGRYRDCSCQNFHEMPARDESETP